MTFKILLELFKATFADWQEDKAAQLAAALAYYTIFSLAPLVLIVLVMAGWFYRTEAVQSYLLEQTGSLVGPAGMEVIKQIMQNASQPNSSLIAAIISVATLLFGASGVFGQLQDALNTVWEVAPRPGRGLMGLIQDRLLSFAMVLGIGFLLLASLILSAALSAVNKFLAGSLAESLMLAQALNFVLSFGLTIFLFAIIYKVLPDVEIQWRDVWIGAGVTTLLFTLGKYLLGFYLSRQSFGSTYGAAGSLLIVLLWVYYSAQILLFGAEFTQVYARRFGSHITPDKGAISLDSQPNK